MTTLKRIVRYADGWMPFPQSVDSLSEKMKTLAGMAREAGRSPIPTSLFAAPSDPDELRRFDDSGLDRALFYLPSAGADVVLPRLDKLAEVVRRAT